MLTRIEPKNRIVRVERPGRALFPAGNDCHRRVAGANRARLGTKDAAGAFWHADCCTGRRSADMPERLTAESAGGCVAGLALLRRYHANNPFVRCHCHHWRLFRKSGCPVARSGSRCHITPCPDRGRRTLDLGQAKNQPPATGGTSQHGHDRSAWRHHAITIGSKLRTIWQRRLANTVHRSNQFSRCTTFPPNRAMDLGVWADAARTRCLKSSEDHGRAIIQRYASDRASC
jgi:hypothetical protein